MNLKNLCLTLSLALTVLLCPVVRSATPTSPPERDPLKTLVSDHPRLLASPARWRQQVERLSADDSLKLLASRLQTVAESIETQPLLTRTMEGRRLLGVSRLALRRVLQLVAAYQISGDTRHVHRAEQELLALAAFSDWNPEHFLDVAEMTTAVSIGYDVFFHEINPATRATLRDAIVNLGIKPGMDGSLRSNGWHTRTNNWNQVCWTGLTLGALAVAEDEPELARQVLSSARANIHFGLEPYAPDGLYPEGPSYWDYGTSFQVLMIQALRQALGVDWNLTASPGFMESGRTLAQLIGPTGLPFNFSDGSESLPFTPVLFWFANELDQPGLLAPHQRNIDAWLQPGSALTTDRIAPLALLWWPDPTAPGADTLPLVWQAGGEQPVAGLRSSWTDPNAIYLATKGGSPSLNHAHMDAGSFVFESDGVRWARDLGAQSYDSLESKGINLWNRAQDSDRWRVFRLNNRSHNTLVIDDQLQRVDGHASIELKEQSPDPTVLVDLTPLYAEQADSVRRGFRLDPDRRIRIRDELTGLRPGAEVRWALVTAATIIIAHNGHSAQLKQNGQTLRVVSLSLGDVRFEQQPAEPPPDDFNASNPDRRILILRGAAPTDGTMQFDVVLTPGSITPETEPTPTVPLAEW